MGLLRRHSYRQPLGVHAELNVTPLLDLAFVLLVIFMITAPLLHQSLEVVLPTTSNEQRAEFPQDVVTLGVTIDGKLSLNGNEVQEAQLTDTLRLLAKDRAALSVVVEMPQFLTVQRLVELLDHVKKAGIGRMGIVTRTLPPL